MGCIIIEVHVYKRSSKNRPCINQFMKSLILSETMKIAILVLALVAVACAASITGNIEEQVKNRLKNRLSRLQQELEITKEMMTEMDESEVAIEAVDEVQKDLNVANAQWGRRYVTRVWNK